MLWVLKLCSFKICVLVLSALSLTTCRSDYDLECTEANTVKIIPHAMDYFFFKTGSWWVYEEESSNERDSIWVGFNQVETNNALSAKTDCQCGKGKCIQIVQNSFSSSKNKEKILYGYRISSDLREGNYEIMESGEVYRNPSGYRMTYKDYKYNSKSPTYGTYEDLDSITVNGKTYTNILHHYYTQQDNIPDWQHEAWYARNIYLVKFRLWDGTTWNLVKYNVIK